MKKLVIAFCSALISISGFAATKPMAAAGHDLSSPPSDGCGLGWQVTQKKTLLATSTRGMTNSVVPYTFGMTSGTLGCDQHPFAKKDEAAASFAIMNFENLRIEMAEGRGENLAAFAQTMGCSDAAAFGEVTKTNYRTIMNGAMESPVQMFMNLKALNACGA